MFVVLGLLVFPSDLVEVGWQAVAVGAVLMFIARPISVFLCLWPFRFPVKELLLISWVGLKGAVPIILGTFPLLFALPNGFLYFNVVFFVVLLSALVQGWTLPRAAQALGLEEPKGAEPPATLDITSLHHVNADIVDYEINEASAAAHLRISELALPDDVVIAMVTRGKEIIPARGATVLLPDDHVFLILRPEARSAVDSVFRSVPKEPEIPLRTGILLPGTTRLHEIDELYGIVLDGEPQENLEHFMRRYLNRPLEEGSFVETQGFRLYVHSIDLSTGPVVGIEEALTP
jgi:potassium/hydrogen antiporter